MRQPVSRFIETHPFVRMLFPFMAGIVVADVVVTRHPIPYIYMLSALLLTLVLLCTVVRKCVWRGDMRFGIYSFSFLFVLGGALCTRQWQEVSVKWPSEANVYEGRLSDVVTEKEHSYLCPVHLTAQWRGDTCRVMDADVYLYLPKDSLAGALQPGYKVCFYGKIASPQRFVPEFDYSRFLYHRCVSGTLYTRHWQLTDTLSAGLKNRALQVRENLLAYSRRSGLTGEEGAVFAALVLGHKGELDDEIRRQYSISGASHVLALSGLHVGVLCFVISVVTALLLPGWRLRYLRYLLVLAVVWMFVFVVGLPVSAVRAAVMFSLFLFGDCVGREGARLNTLALTAFGMLVYNPFYLFDVGFQMSFSAVAALLLLQPWIQSAFPRQRNGVVRYVWGITSASLAAQIGVVPLILHYFSRWSPYALLVNLWVVPLASVVVCVSVPFLLLSLFPFPVLQMVAGWCVCRIVSLMNAGVFWINRLPGADVSGLSFSIIDTLFLYAMLGILFYGLVYRQRRMVVWLLVGGCLAVGWRYVALFCAW